MTYLLLAYGLIMLAVGLYYWRKVVDFKEYVVAGGRQSGMLVALSMLTTIIGASATLGVASLAVNVGFPAFWWLGAGAVGLLLQAWLLSARVRELGAHTLPDVAGIIMGKEARMLIGLVIVISWTGIVAAQFTALSQIIFVLTGLADTRAILVFISLGVIVYTVAGGQIPVMRTDALQFVFIFGGVGAACFFLYQGEGIAELSARVEWLNARFDAGNLLTLALLVGSAFFIGPDVFSRNLTAKDAKTARRATAAAGLVLVVFSVLLVFLALWVVEQGNEKPELNPLLLLIRDYLPVPLGVFLGFGLLSALVSSADTCLLSAASIVENDLLGGRSLKRVRLLVLLVGLFSLGIALARSDIIALLMTTYSVYVPGVVPPLFVAIMCHGGRTLSKPIWLLAVVAGGACGMAGGLAGSLIGGWVPHLPLVGMGLSAILALASVRRSYQSPGTQE